MRNRALFPRFRNSFCTLVALLVVALASPIDSTAQMWITAAPTGLSINWTSMLTFANPAAALDVDVSDPALLMKRGILIPRMTAAQRMAIVLGVPAQGLLVYQTDAPQGFYYNTSVTLTPTWVLLASSGTNWSPVGNAGTVDGTNFLGTTDNIPLSFRVNNIRAGRIDHTTFANTFFGFRAGNVNPTFSATTIQNTAVGMTALQSNTAGGSNAALGFRALGNNTTGSNNTATGRASLWNNTTGTGNTGLGYDALLTNTTGTNNTGVGLLADVGSNALTNATAIGWRAQATQSNTLVLGSVSGANGAGTTVRVGIGTTTPAAGARLDIVGAIKVTDGTQGVGRVLTSDANGLASWQPLPGGSAPTYYIGQLYGGGIIFYIWFDGTVQRALIAGLTDAATTPAWSNVAATLGVAAQSYHDGAANTAAIIAQAGHTGSAAQDAMTYGPAIEQWYLPSLNEINLLYNQEYILNRNLPAAGRFVNSYYWSSTEDPNAGGGSALGAMKGFNLKGQGIGGYPKNMPCRVRAIRSVVLP